MAFDPGKSCANCPAYLRAEDARTKFKKSIGSPMCGRYGHVLGKPGIRTTQAAKLQSFFANKCDAYGKPMPSLPQDDKMEVCLPDLDSQTRVVADSQREACISCAMCQNFVRDDIVADELGWTAGLCAAKGKLILPHRQANEARGCEFRAYGPIRSSTTGLHLLPEYEDAFALNVNPVSAYFKSRENFVEPHEYPTDKSVSEADTKVGIRAWRLVKDPEGTGNEVYLPIYNPDFFSEEERVKIPRTSDDEHPELYVDFFGGVYLAAVTWTQLDETPALMGEAGIGKTELFRHLAWLMCLPFERISITGSTELDDLAGKMHYSPDKGTYFTYGRLPKAWIKPCVICIDEPNVGAPDVWQFIRPLTDNSKQLVLDMNNGEHLDRNTDCYLGLAMNPPWDPKYVGAQQISDADASRLFWKYIELPPAQLEREIIKERVKLDGWEIDDARLNTIMAIAEELRGLAKDGTLPISWAIRPQIKVARATRWFDIVTAYRRAIGDSLEPEALDAMLDVVRAHTSE